MPRLERVRNDTEIVNDGAMSGRGSGYPVPLCDTIPIQSLIITLAVGAET